MKKVLAFLIAAALLLLFCVSVFGEDASSIFSGSGSLPLGYSASDFADVDSAFLAANSVGNVSVTYSLNGSSFQPYSFGTYLSVPSSFTPYSAFKFSVSGLDPDSFYLIKIPFSFSGSKNSYFFDVDSSIFPYMTYSSFPAPVFSAVLTGQQLSNFYITVHSRLFLSSFSGSASGSLSGSMYAVGQGSIGSGSGSLLGNFSSATGLFSGSLSGLNGYLSIPNFNFSSGSSVSLDTLSFSPSVSGFSHNFGVTLDSPFIVPLSDLVNDPSAVTTISGLAGMLSSFWKNQDNDYQESINPDLDDKTNEANQIVEDTENFENDIFTSADNALGEIDIENQKLPDSFSAPFLWIGQLVVALFNQLGDFKIVILFPMYLGLCLLAIGRGGQAIQRINYRGRGGGSDA